MNIEFTPVVSNTLSGLHYDADNKKMAAKFKNNAIYAYDDISQDEYDSIINDTVSINSKLRKVTHLKEFRRVN